MAARFRLSAPEPAEREIHEAVAHALDVLLLPPAMWACYPAGASALTPQQQARHSRIGLKRGMPDIWILFGRLWLIELKRKGGRLSKTRIVRTKRGGMRVLAGQEATFPMLLGTGAVGGIAICTSVMEVLEQLVEWGVPVRPFHGRQLPPDWGRQDSIGSYLAAANAELEEHKLNAWHSRAQFLEAEQKLIEANAEIERFTRTLNYVADMTYCGADAEWHFKHGYGPQSVLDALASPNRAAGTAAPAHTPSSAATGAPSPAMSRAGNAPKRSSTRWNHNTRKDVE